jgi:ubiquinone/menaquinone biosynthesis C-methylase UbiE
MSEKGTQSGEERPSIANRFDHAHSAHRRSPTLRRVWREAYGEDYADEVNPSAFYSRSTLQRLSAGLRVGSHTTLVDLGCGNGGAGLWIAREFGTNLIGVDLSSAGIAAASDLAAELGMGGRAKFLQGDVIDTGLQSSSCDGAISLDVLCFVPDKPAALGEVARILRLGARFCFTTWEQEGYSPRLKAMQLADHRAALIAAGFDVELYEEPANWRQQQKDVLEGLLASERYLSTEMEQDTVDRFIGMARGALAEMSVRRYVSVIARRV